MDYSSISENCKLPQNQRYKKSQKHWGKVAVGVIGSPQKTIDKMRIKLAEAYKSSRSHDFAKTKSAID